MLKSYFELRDAREASLSWYKKTPCGLQNEFNLFLNKASNKTCPNYLATKSFFKPAQFFQTQTVYIRLNKPVPVSLAPKGSERCKESQCNRKNFTHNSQ